MKLLLTSILSMFISLASIAQHHYHTGAAGHEKYQGPYARDVASDANIAQEIVHVLDNATVGSVQSVIGASHIIFYFILNSAAFGDFKVALGTHTNQDSEVSQITIKEPVINACAYSLGLFQVGQCAEKHEGGHSVASATLGPMYLPMVSLSYLTEGHHNSFFEKWADMEINPNDFAWTNQTQLGVGTITQNGKSQKVLVVKFSIDQNQKTEYNELSQSKFYRWLDTNIAIPLVENSNQGANSQLTGKRKCSGILPAFVDISILSKEVELAVRKMGGEDHNLSFFIRSHEKLGSVSNPGNAILSIKPLVWENQYGLQYSLDDVVTLRTSVGGKVGAEVLSAEKYNLGGDYEFQLFGGVTGQVDLDIAEYVRLYGRYDKLWGTAGTTYTKVSTGLTNEFRNPFNNVGFLNYLEIGAEASQEEIKLGGENKSIAIERLDFTAGFRF